jgi:hypothetical protein
MLLFRIVDNLIGIVSIICGVYSLLYVYRVLPLKIKDPKSVELWHQQYDKLMKVCGPILIVGGLLFLFGIL